jgi:hypothetical protein
MEKKEVPQDDSALRDFTREVCYVKDETGKYNTVLSSGWEAKKAALDNAWNDIDDRIALAKSMVLKNEKSPIYYFMELKLMDISVLKGYTGFFGFQIKNHFKPSVFEKLSDHKLQKYANAFEITLDDLKNFKA